MASKKQSKRKYRANKKTVDRNMARGGGSGSVGSNYVTLPEGVEWFKPEYKDGKKTALYHLNVIPFIAGGFNPEADEGELWFRSGFRVGQVGADNKKVASPSIWGHKCPMSDLFFEMRENPDIPKKELEKLGTKHRELYYITDCKDKNKKIQLLDFSSFLFGAKIDEEMGSEEYEEEGVDAQMFYDPVDGLTLKIVFKQKVFKGRTYSDVSKLSFVARKGKVTDSMIDSLVDPIELIDKTTTKQIKAMMADNDSGGDSDDDDLEDMTRAELKRYIKENDLDVTVKKAWDDDEIRDAIQSAMDDGDEDEDSDDDEDEDDLNYDSDTDDDDEDEDDEEDDDLDDMSRNELKAYIKENDLDITVKKKWDLDDIISAIKKEQDDDEDDDEDSDDEEFFDDDED